MARLGRRPKFSPERAAKFLELLKVSSSVENAAIKAGLDDSTIYGWVAKGRASKRRNEFVEFSEQYQLAQAERDMYREAKVEKAGEKDWRALAWLMSISNPRKYSTRLHQHLDNEYRLAASRVRAAFKKLPAEKTLTPAEAAEYSLAAMVGELDAEKSVDVPNVDPHLGELP